MGPVWRAIATAALVGLVACTAAVSGTTMQLHLMQNEVAGGAVCLDGTPAGFYYSAAQTTADANNWIIYFQGGGWCYDEEDCWGRSKTNLGSSKAWKTTGNLGGLISDDCTVNPDLCNFNRVWLVYCDGNSFSGNRDEAVVVNGDPLYFRGRRVMDAVFRTLFSTYNLGKAEQVLLTGCSAGGLSTYLHADYVGGVLKAQAPGLTKYKAAPISGFFLQHDTVEGKPVYPQEMQNIFNLANSTDNLNSACVASKAPADKWMCNFAQHSYEHITSPIFPLNSALDSWQTGCIYTSELAAGFPKQSSTANGNCSAAPGWADCSHNPEQCTNDQATTMVQYEIDFQTIMNSTTTYTEAGNGAFVYSCHSHCAPQGSGYTNYKIGGVSMQQAVSKWWLGDNTVPASENTYTPCLYNTQSTPRQCNPSCG